MKHKLLAICIGFSMVMGTALAADWYEATGNPAARSAMNSATLRTEFSSIQTDIADKLPVLTGNEGKVVVVNPGGTALTVNAAGILVAGGGTGATTADGARTNLGLAIGTDIQAWDAGLSFMAALAMTDGYIMVGNGSAWVLESPVTARDSLGVGVGTDVQAWDVGLDQIAALGVTDNNFMVGNGAAWAAESGATARASLGVSIGSQVQAFDTELGEIAALTDADSTFIVGTGAVWQAETGTTVLDSLNLGTADTPQWTSIEVGHATDSTLTRVSAGVLAVEGVTLATAGGSQPADDELTEIAALVDTDGNIIVGNGSAWVAESGATARTSLGVGTGDSPQFTTPYMSTGIEIGHASDTTLTRLSAGVLQVEGVTLASASAGQPADDELTEIAALIDANSAFIVGDGAAWVAESGATARASLGVSIGSQVQAYDATIMVDADIGSTVQAQDTELDEIAGLANTDSNIIVGNGASWVAESGATARTSLGVGTGDSPQLTGIELGHASDTTLVRVGAGVMSIEGSAVLTSATGQLQDTELTEIAALANTDSNIIVGDGAEWVAESGATARTSLGVGTTDSPQWTSPYVSTSIEVGHASDTTLTRLSAGVLQVEGVTLASAAAGQPADDELTEIAALLDTDGNFIVGNGSAWVAESTTTARTSMGVAIGSDVQEYDADLTALAGLAKTDSNFIVGNGSTWLAETGATARTSMGLGSLATQATINNADWSGTDLAVGNGGTGSSSAGDARTALGLAIGSQVQAYDSTILVDADIDVNVQSYDSTNVTDSDLGNLGVLDTVNNDQWSGTDLTVVNGGTGSGTASGARTNLGLVIGTDVQDQDDELDDIAGLATTLDNFIVATGSGWAAEDASTARGSLGLGSLALDDDINNSDWNGTALAVANGGTASTTAADARAALSAQAASVELGEIAGLSNETNGNIIVGTGTVWQAESGTTARTSLGLGTGDSPQFTSPYASTGFEVGHANDTTITRVSAGVIAIEGVQVSSGSFQPLDTELTEIAALANTNSNFIVGNGSVWVAEEGATARTSLGLGSLATASNISNSNWSGTDLSVLNGGTGVSTLTGLLKGNGTSAITGSATINNGNWSGTDLALINGGTGAGTAAAAASALGVGTEDSPQFTSPYASSGVNVGNATDTKLTRQSAGELEVAGRAILAHDDTAYVSAHIIVTDTEPVDLTGMATGDIKLVY